ncbi:MAG: sulfotransferase family protein [Acidimicrobiales bacterium]
MGASEREQPPTAAAVRLDDLADPKFPPHVVEQRQRMAALAALVPWDAEGLVAIAAGQAGLGAGVVERLQTILDCYAETPLSAPGRLATAGALLGFVKSRLLIDQELERHPEIRDIPVEAPIAIVGLPRTGTTHLHNILAADPGLRYLPYWEAVEPVLPDADRVRGGVDPRWERTETTLQMLNEAMPYFKRMHHMTTWHAHEEINLLALDMSTMLFECLALSPPLRDWYKGHDQTPHYRFLRTVMQVLQFLRPGPARWVLKSPQNLEQLAALNAVFPDATVVFTHRDPVSVTASMITMQAYLYRTAYDHIDLDEVGSYWSDRVRDLLMACLRDRDLVNDRRSLDLRFADFMADQETEVARIYELAGQPVTDASVRGWRTYLRDHPADRHGKVLYELERFGVDPVERRAAFAPYVERFKL